MASIQSAEDGAGREPLPQCLDGPLASEGAGVHQSLRESALQQQDEAAGVLAAQDVGGEV